MRFGRDPGGTKWWSWRVFSAHAGSGARPRGAQMAGRPPGEPSHDAVSISFIPRCRPGARIVPEAPNVPYEWTTAPSSTQAEPAAIVRETLAHVAVDRGRGGDCPKPHPGLLVDVMAREVGPPRLCVWRPRSGSALLNTSTLRSAPELTRCVTASGGIAAPFTPELALGDTDAH